MKRSPFFAMALLALAIVASGCSRKGSSSLSSSHKSTTSKVTPKVRTTTSTTSSDAALKAAQEAEAKAKAAAEEAAAAAKKAKEEAEAKAKAAAEEAAAAAKKAKEEAEAKAKAAAEEAAAAAKKAKETAEQTVVVKEEKVKVVESEATTDDSNRYHIIIGSFKQLTNARQQSQDAVSKGFYPSIMENEEGMYRVAVFSSGTESSARKKIAELRKKYTEYVGMWLLIEKK